MLRFFIAIILIVNFNSGVKAQAIPSSCVSHDSIVNMYLRDATALTLERIYTNNDTHKDSVEIPLTYIDTILNAMIAVYNVSSLPERDTVLDIYDIHVRTDYSLQSFILSADSNLIWMQELQIGNLNSGFVELDDIILGHDFVIDSYFNFGNNYWYHYVGFTTDNYINIGATVSSLENSPELRNLEHSGDSFDGSDIEATIFDNYVELKYIYRWGDCPSGCIYQRTWVFNVYFDCSVEFITSFDGIEVTAINENSSDVIISIGPNPTKDYVNVFGLENTFTYCVFDINGNEVKNGSINEPGVIDISDLADGIFIIEIQSENHIYRERIIKL